MRNINCVKPVLCICSFLLMSCTGRAQTQVSLSPVPKLQFLDVNGKPLAGGCVFTYSAGTTTPQATYTDATGSTPNTNPVILDLGGRASIWLSSSAYKIAVWSSGGVACASGIQQYSIDGITSTNLNSASQLVSSAANPANTGFIRMANGDSINWRNNANLADIGLSQAGAVSTGNGNLADVLRYGNATAGGLQAQRYLDFSPAPAQSGVLAGGNNTCLVAARNAAGNADVCAVQVNGSNVLMLGGNAGISINGGAAINGQSGTGNLCLTTNCAMTTPNIGAATAAAVTTTAANPAQSGVLRCAGNQACTVARTPDNTNDVQLGYTLNGPRAIFGSIGGSTSGVTAELGELQVDTGITVQSTGFKHFRLGSGTSCTTPGAQGSTCTTSSISLPGPPFPDANYTLICIQEGPATGTPVIGAIGSKSPGSFTLGVVQVGTAASSYGQADCIAIHD